MRNVQCFVAVCMAICIIGVAILMWHFFWVVSTTYPSGWNEKAFRSIEVGQTVDSVLESIGLPLEIVIQDEGKPPMVLTGEVDRKIIDANANRRMVLQYTTPSKKFGDPFVDTEVIVSDGLVVRTASEYYHELW